jgi:arylsulfatase A-like enzyme
MRKPAIALALIAAALTSRSPAADHQSTRSNSKGGPRHRADADEKDKRPNIVFIFADDLGWSDVGCYGAKYYETPNIDRLASGGIRFTSGYMNSPNCAPSRAAIYSGQYAPRTGMYNVSGSERGEPRFRNLVPPRNTKSLDLSKITMGDAMRGAGYATALFGKWHLGYDEEYLPHNRGFDEAYACYKPTLNGHWAPKFQMKPEIEAPEGAYLGDFITDLGLDFIERHKNGEKPFFLSLNQFLVHGPLQAPADLIEKYEGKAPDGKDDNPIFAAMVESLDYNVGRVMRKLHDAGLADNTVVVFSSDNGGVGGYAEVGIEKGNYHTSNLPLHGGKTHLYEGGIRVPFIVRWPGVIKGGSVTDQPVMGIDLYPTFLEIAGATQPKHYILDGVSFAPLLKSSGKTELPERDLFWHFPAYCAAPHGEGRLGWRSTPHSAIQSGDYKLVRFYVDGARELYSMRDDMEELHNLAASMPEKVGQLESKLDKWLEDTGAAMPYKKKVARTGEPFDSEKHNLKTGMSGEFLNSELAKIQGHEGSSGICLYDVAKRSPADFAGLMESDIVYEIDGRKVGSPKEVEEFFARHEPGNEVVVKFFRRKDQEAKLKLHAYDGSGEEVAATHKEEKFLGAWTRDKGGEKVAFDFKPQGVFTTSTGGEATWRPAGAGIELIWKGGNAIQLILDDDNTLRKDGSKSEVWRRTKGR